MKILADSIGNDKPTYSNGAVYADLDNDGDLDMVVNNIDDPVLVYKNKSNDKNDKRFVEIKLKGSGNNMNAIGAKVVVFAKQESGHMKTTRSGDFNPACRYPCI